MKYLPLFILIQVVSVVLGFIGLPIIAYYAYVHPQVRLAKSPLTGKAILHFAHKWTWLWDNDEDGIDGGGSWNQQWSIGRRIFTWSALRNSVNNLRFVKRLLWLPISVSAVGRPLWYRTWTMFGKQFYAKAGWLSDGYPCCSAGAGRGY